MYQRKTQKRVSGISEKIGIAAIILLVVLIICTFIVYGMFKNIDAAPSLFGYRIYIMNNDTMGEQIKKGSAVFIKEGLMPTNVGNVILVTCPDTESSDASADGENASSETRLAIVAYCGTQDVTMPDGSVIAKHIVKYGNAPDDQRWVVNTEDIIGKAESYDPALGAVIRFVSSKAGVLVLVIIPCGLIVLYEIVLLVISLRKKLPKSNGDPEEEYGYPADPEDARSEGSPLQFGSRSAAKSGKPAQIARTAGAPEKAKEEYSEKTIAFDIVNRESAVNAAENTQFKKNEGSSIDSILKTASVNKKPETVAAEPAAKKAEAYVPRPAAAVQPKPEAPKPATADTRSSAQRIDELMKMLKEETDKLSKN